MTKAEEKAQRLKEVEEMRKSKILTASETAAYLGINVNTLYAMMSRREIPYYKPGGKNTFFKVEDLENHLLRGRVATEEEIESKAQSICLKRKMGIKA